MDAKTLIEQVRNGADPKQLLETPKWMKLKTDPDNKGNTFTHQVKFKGNPSDVSMIQGTIKSDKNFSKSVKVTDKGKDYVVVKCYQDHLLDSLVDRVMRADYGDSIKAFKVMKTEESVTEIGDKRRYSMDAKDSARAS